ncbi:MAG: DUF1343 domain-containing protein [Verrucomicrobiota bacterium]
MPTRRSLLRLALAAPAVSLFPSCGTMDTGPFPGIGTSGGGGPFALGIDTLAESGFAAVRGKRVGLILNQTSVSRNGTPSRVILQRALGRNFTSLYTPEHGLDGREKAGIHVSSRRDPLTGLPAYSLYGDTRKPAPRMLADIDVLLFDLQDIGSRSYTYISTMALAMEACAEQGKEFIVLDRPNPLGGLRVQGPPLDPRWKSFVGQIPVPYVHGMTAGELARMINARGWIKARPRLSVIPLRGWQRGMAWTDTGLRWVATSPNIPGPLSPFYYAVSGILGGLDGVDIGIGTPRPFEYAGGKGINPHEFSSALTARGIPGVRFAPYFSARKPGFAGAQLTIDPHGATDLMALAVILASEVCRRTGNAPVRATRGDTRTLFHKVYGSDTLFNALASGRPVGSLIASWQPSLQAFRANRQPFLMY